MAPEVERPVSFTYTNWQDKTTKRRVLPMRIWFGASEYHLGRQWFLRGWDLERTAVRDFAMSGISDWT